MRVAMVDAGRRPATKDHRKLLKSFYHALGGPRWKNKDNWLSKKPLQEWFGIGVNVDGDVIEISLTENKLNGSFPDCLPDTLEELVLTNNRIKGQLPQELPPTLKILDCCNNILSGRIPSQLPEGLEEFMCNNNNLSGTVPPQVPKNLKKLCLKNNSKKFAFSKLQIDAVKAQAPGCKVLFASARRYSLFGADENG
jgi:hypothetical protein